MEIAAFLGLALAGGLAARVLEPERLAAVLLVISPLLPGAARALPGPGDPPLLLAFALPAVAGAAIRRMRSGVASPLPHRTATWGAAFLAVAAVSAVSSILRGYTLFALREGVFRPAFVNGLWMTAAERAADAVKLLGVFALLLPATELFLRARSARDGERTLLGALAAGLLAALSFAALERAGALALTETDWLNLGRRAGPFEDPNAFGIALGLALPLVLAALASGVGTARVRRASAAGLVLVLSAIALETSGSRSGLLLLVLGALAGGAGLLRQNPRRLGPFLAIAVVLGLSAFAVIRYTPRDGSASFGGLVKRLGASLGSGSFNALASNRPVFWRAAFDVIREEPLSGCGLAGFPYVFPERSSRNGPPPLFTDNATNALLDVGAECGLPGLLLALAAVVPLLVRALDACFGRATELVPRAAGAVLLGFFVSGFLGSHLRFPTVALFAALAVALLPLEADPVAAEAAEPRRFLPVLVASGALASLLAVLTTLEARTAFRTGPWIGIHPWEIHAENRWQRWMDARAIRQLGPRETSLDLLVRNERPDGRPVLVTASVNGVPRVRLSVPVGAHEPLALSGLPAGGLVRLDFDPVFRPRRLTGANDDRTLSLILANDATEKRASAP
ncbi:MAG: O-antigen ligase family protein [Acidobacteria bacterium]|nr:O-antigen ligase family protein [Acidobacteriota bacterium]